MAQYFIVLFKNPSQHESKIEKWSCAEGSNIAEGSTLFTYMNQGKSFALKSPVSGVLKVQLYPEGQLIGLESEVAILSIEDKAADLAAQAGQGKIITPEELDETIAHAEAASIRMPS